MGFDKDSLLTFNIPTSNANEHSFTLGKFASQRFAYRRLTFFGSSMSDDRVAVRIFGSALGTNSSVASRGRSRSPRRPHPIPDEISSHFLIYVLKNVMGMYDCHWSERNLKELSWRLHCLYVHRWRPVSWQFQSMPDPEGNTLRALAGADRRCFKMFGKAVCYCCSIAHSLAWYHTHRDMIRRPVCHTCSEIGLRCFGHPLCAMCWIEARS